jgi:hypothetical protein
LPEILLECVVRGFEATGHWSFLFSRALPEEDVDRRLPSSAKWAPARPVLPLTNPAFS